MLMSKSMFEAPGLMDATLVAYYGKKSDELAEFIRFFQSKISGYLGSAFRPYEMEQVHGTIIGLEGQHVHGKWLNKNFLEQRQEERAMDFGQILGFLRSKNIPDCNIRVGGFRHYEPSAFTSRGHHPYLRS